MRRAAARRAARQRGHEAARDVGLRDVSLRASRPGDALRADAAARRGAVRAPPCRDFPSRLQAVDSFLKKSKSRHRRHVATPPHVVAATRSPQARGSANRDRMVRETGRFQVPFLRDPNTGVELFESAAIVAYLDEVYTV